jgi:hypothetical protein
MSMRILLPTLIVSQAALLFIPNISFASEQMAVSLRLGPDNEAPMLFIQMSNKGVVVWTYTPFSSSLEQGRRNSGAVYFQKRGAVN